MPYIEAARRPLIDNFLHSEFTGLIHTPESCPANAGELNYAISQVLLADAFEWETIHKVNRVCQFYLDCQPLRYQRINDVMGALDGARREYMRRVQSHSHKAFAKVVLESVASAIYADVAAPYEDKKISENGDLNYGAIP